MCRFNIGVTRSSKKSDEFTKKCRFLQLILEKVLTYIKNVIYMIDLVCIYSAE